jgi:hypothetical protein
MTSDTDCAKVIIDVDSCNQASLQCSLVYTSGYWACGQRSVCQPVTRTVREGASVLGTASHATLDMTSDTDCAKVIIDVDSCNQASLQCSLVYTSGCWACGQQSICQPVTRTVREAASVHGTASHATLDMTRDTDCAKVIIDVDSCNQASLQCSLVDTSGYWACGQRSVCQPVTRTVREGASVLGTGL